MKPVIRTHIVQFKSMKDIEHAYNIFLNDIFDTIKLVDNKQVLEASRLKVLDLLSIIENKLASIANV